MKVTEAKEKELIPKYYHKFYKEKCECGAELEVTSTLTRYYCPNLRCKDRVAIMIVNLANKIGIKGIGLKRAYDMLETGTPSPLALIKHIKNDSEWFNIYCQFKERPISFVAAIRLLSIPNVDKKVESLFKHIPNYEYWEFHIKQRGGFDNWLMSVTNSSTDTFNKLRDKLIEFMPEVKMLDQVFKITDASVKRIPIVITGKPKGYERYGDNAKQKYIDDLNEISYPVFEFYLSTAYTRAPVFIADTDTPTIKYRKAAEIETLTGHKRLSTSWEFKEKMEKSVPMLLAAREIED